MPEREPSRDTNNFIAEEVGFNDGLKALEVNEPGAIVNFESSNHKHLRDIGFTPNPIRIVGKQADGNTLELFYAGSVVLPVITDENGTKHYQQVIDRTKPGKAMAMGTVQIGAKRDKGKFSQIDSVGVLYKNHGIAGQDADLPDNPYTEALDKLHEYFQSAN